VPKQLLLRFRKRALVKFTIFLIKNFVTADTEVNRSNNSYLKNLSLSDMNENVRVIPFSKALAKVMVLGIVTNKGKNCNIFYVPDREQVTADFYQTLPHWHVWPLLSAT
jgi:hypothetical protein